jgi:hypothetical protein
MKDFTAELEQVFGVVPSRETGLEIDMFDGAGLGGGAGEAAGTICRATICRIDGCGGTCICRTSAAEVAGSICRASVPEVAGTICRTSVGSDGVNMCRVAVPA